jgi:hypothetical protein
LPFDAFLLESYIPRLDLFSETGKFILVSKFFFVYSNGNNYLSQQSL